jgi:hypothetical protein
MNAKRIKELKAQAQELIDFGDSHEKNEGHGMLRVIEEFENSKTPKTKMINKGFKTHNDKEIECGGTSYVGEICCSFKSLKEVFGQPTESDGYKSDAEWIIEFPDKKVATIYNYKNGKNYLGREGKATSKITDWHIGGKDEIIVKRIEKILGL